ncbi:unnamed protein product [Lampetra planeri]
MEPTTGADVTPAADGRAELPHPLRPDDLWRRVETQLSDLTTALLHLVALVMRIAAGGGPVVDCPGADVQRPVDGASEGPPLVDTTAIPGRVETAAISQSPATTHPILNTTVESGVAAATLLLPRNGSPDIATPAAKESTDCGPCLPQVREFVATGGDWRAFRWRFEAAYKSVCWSEEEALIALPTILDNDALAIFRSIPPEKKKTLKEAFAHMAEVYKPSDDRTRKFQHHRRGNSELPLAYRSALMALAVNADPNVQQEILDPLVMIQPPSRACWRWQGTWESSFPRAATSRKHLCGPLAA